MKLTKKNIIGFLQENKLFLKERFDVDEIRLFGSFARNEATEKSDIDLLVKFGKPSYDNLFELKVWLERELKRECDIVRYRKSMKQKFLNRIEKEMSRV